MEFTDKEAADYLAGKVTLVTSRKTGTSRFVPTKKRAYDKGITSPEKRAYWRVWYLKNRKKRQAYEAARKAAKTTPGLPDHVVAEARGRIEDSRLAKKRAYQRAWRKKNAAKLPEMRRRWAGKTAAPVAQAPVGTAAERKAAYLKAWRLKNKVKLAAKARAAYRAMKDKVAKSRVETIHTPSSTREAFIAGALGADRVVEVRKKGLLEKFLGWF